MKKREIISENKLFKLIRQQRGHKSWYEIQVYATRVYVPVQLEQELEDYFGKPYGKWGFQWRIWNRIEAEKQFVYAALRWC